MLLVNTSILYKILKSLEKCILILCFTFPFIVQAEKVTDKSNVISALTVYLVKPELKNIPIKLFANGNIAAWQESIIGSELNGFRLNQVLVNVGDEVKKGQLLAEFSDESILADLAQANASLVEAQAQTKEAINNEARATSLQNTGALSNQQIDQYVTVADTAKARVEVAKAIVEVQKIRLKNTRIIAPDNGIISSRTATEGAVLEAGSELFKLIRQSRLEWRAEILSSNLPKIKIGLPVIITSADGSVFKGKVRQISPVVDLQTRNTLVYIDLPRNSSAKAGMFARGEFLLGQLNSLVIPQQSIVMRDGFNYVFIVENNRVRQIKVMTGVRFGNMVEIISGLKPNQNLVANGGAFLTDNDLVKVVTRPKNS